MTDTATTKELRAYESGLGLEKHNSLALSFNSFMDEVNDLVKLAGSIEIDGVDDLDGMQSARRTRIMLRSIRVDVEKTRKSLKAESLRESKAIDGMANIVKFIIMPVEERLQEQEDTVKLIEQKRLEELIETRTVALEAFSVDCSAFNLGGMSEEGFAGLLSSSELGYKARIQAEEQERARLQAEREENWRIQEEKREKERAASKRIEAENAKLRKQAEVSKEKLRKERAAMRERDARRQADAEKKEQARLALHFAPDKEKLDALTESICALQLPTVSTEIALDTIQHVRGFLNRAVKRLRHASSELSD